MLGNRVPVRRARLGMRRTSLALARALIVGAALVVVPPATGALSQERELAERYAPVVRLVERTGCPPGKPYQPIDVDLLFGEPTVALTGPWSRDVVKIGPSAQD